MFANWTGTIVRCGLLLAITVQLVSIALNSRVESLKISSIDVESGELPSNVVPLEYNVEMLFVDSKGTLGRGKVELLFRMGHPNPSHGRESSLLCIIDKKCARNSKKDRLVLHLRHNTFEMPEFDDVIMADSIDDARTRDGERVRITELKVNEYHHLLVVQLDRSLRLDSYGSIKLSYRIKGTANELQSLDQNPLVHSSPGEVHRLFPCIDDPHLKSKLRLTVKQPNPNMRIVANTEPRSGDTDWEKVTFRQTPVAIPLHSLAFAFVPSDKAQRRSHPIGHPADRKVLVHGSKAQLSKSQYAMQFAASSIRWMETYLNNKHNLPVNMNLIPLSKESSEHIGSDAHAGLGLGAINEEFMLIDEDMSSVDRKTESAFEVALVVARQWFGSLLTPRTKADSWITEGLASYMASRMVRELAPQLEIDQYFNSVMRAQVDARSINRNRRILIKAAQVVDMLRRNVAKSKRDFDSIIRNLFDEQQDVSIKDLARVFATKELDKKKLLEIIESRARQCEQTDVFSADPWIELDIHGNQLIVELYQVDNVLLPVALRLKLSTADGSKQIIRDVKLDSFNKRNSRVKFELPSWFDLHDSATDWLIVSQDDTEALTNFRVRYSDKLLERLRGPLKEGNRLLKPRERVDIVTDEVQSLKLTKYAKDNKARLAKVVGMFANEYQPEVVLELLPAFDILSPSDRNSISLKATNYWLWIQVPDKTKANEERLKSATLRLLAKHKDKEAIQYALDKFSETSLNGALLGAQAEAIHEIVSQFGSRDQRNRLLYRLTEGKSRDETIRISKQLRL